MSAYPAFLQRLLDNCPPAGAGVHPWLFKIARYLHRYHPPEEIQVPTPGIRRARPPVNGVRIGWQPRR